MAQPRIEAYAILQAQEPLPPYELDPHFHNPVIYKRVGDLIARPTVLGRFGRQ